MDLIFTIEKPVNPFRDTADSIFERMITYMKDSNEFRILSCKNYRVSFEYHEDHSGFFAPRNMLYLDKGIIEVIKGIDEDVLRFTYPVSYVEVLMFVIIALLITFFASPWAMLFIIVIVLQLWHEIIKTRKKCENILSFFIDE